MKFLFFIIIAVFYLSCDDDLSTVGGQVIDTIPGNGFTQEEFAVTAYSERIQKVEINRLPGVLLGKNENIFGSTTHSLLSQVELESYDLPAVDDSAVLESVVLSIPYFNTAVSAETDPDTQVTTTTYRLDSIRNIGGKLNLSLIASNYFLSNFDTANLENNKTYFNDEFSSTGEIVIPALNQTITLTNEIIISPTELSTTNPECGDTAETVTKRPPAIEISSTDSEILSFFNTQILQKLGSAEFSNSNNFQQSFRGFYLKVNSGTDALAYLSLTRASVTLNYTEIDASKTPSCAQKIKKTLALNFQGNTLNLVQENSFDPLIATEIQIQDKDNGADKIYLNGGVGIIGVLKIFSETPEVLEELKNENVIVNDALLRFYLDDQFSEEEIKELKSQRLFIYNYETGEPLVDFTSNPQFGTANPETAYSNHLGLLQEENGDYFFDIKITQHVKNLIYNNAETIENPLLGLCVTANTELPLSINPQTGNLGLDPNAIKSVDTGTSGTTKIPVGSIIDPNGLILVGNNTANPVDPKKLKLLLTYTQSIN